MTATFPVLLLVFAGIVILFQDGSNPVAFSLIGLPLALIFIFGFYQLAWKRFFKGGVGGGSSGCYQDGDGSSNGGGGGSEQQLKFCPLCEDRVPGEEWSRDGHR